jgi:hypothetical protein
MSSALVPGLYGLLGNPSFRRIETLNRNPGAQASGEHRGMTLSRVPLRDDLSFRRETAVRMSTITMRLGWLARAAFVFCNRRPAQRGSAQRSIGLFLALHHWRADIHSFSSLL